MRWGKTVSATVLVALWGAAATGAAEAQIQTKPNVVVVLTDDQPVSQLSYMPATLQTLVATGTTFTRAHSSFPLCCPARVSLLTGRHAHNHGVRSNRLPLGGYAVARNVEPQMLPVALQAAGYRTAYIGKYLNGYGIDAPAAVPPGWDDWRGSIDPTSYAYFGTTLNVNGVPTALPLTDLGYQSDAYGQFAVDRIEAWAPSTRPFFLTVSFTAPHTGGSARADQQPPAPYAPVPAPRHRTLFANTTFPKALSFDEADVSDKPLWIRNLPRFVPDHPIGGLAAIEGRVRAQVQSLQSVDQAVGRMVNTLARVGELDNTVIVFTSDNGFHNGEHRIAAGKEAPYTESVRIPLVVKIPGGVKRASSAPVGLHDLAPTIAELAGATLPVAPDGRSLVPVVRDGATFSRDMLLESFDTVINGLPEFRGIVSGRWKLVVYTSGEIELYDLQTDPFELRNRAADALLLPTRTTLMGRLATLQFCAGAACSVNRLPVP